MEMAIADALADCGVHLRWLPTYCCTFLRAQDVSKMVDALPDVEIKEIHHAMVGVFERMKENLLAEGILPDNLPKRAPAKV